MMSKLEQIEAAIAELPSDEFARLRAWFDEYEASLWDDQIEQDVQAGKLDPLGEQALDDLRRGRVKPL